MVINHFSPSTIKSYMSVMRRLLAFHKLNPVQLTQDQLVAYVCHIKEERNLSSSSMRIAISSIKYFYRNVIGRPSLVERIPYPKKEKHIRTILTGAEMLRLFERTGNLKHRLLLKLVYSAGLRRSEVVKVRPEDFDDRGPLAGIAFQRQWEQRAFQAGGGDWHAPAQPLLEFLHGRGGVLRSSCRPTVTHADLSACLPAFAVAGLRKALPQFNRRMRGFVGPEATLVGVETRTSAPLRILRGQDGESISHPGLFPAGEGAGYAGGIMSAAVDGLKVAISILQRYQH